VVDEDGERSERAERDDRYAEQLDDLRDDVRDLGGILVEHSM
jgi:hypothetical protein